MPMMDGPLHVARLQMSCWSCLASVANRIHNAWNGRECVGLVAQIPSLTRAGSQKEQMTEDAIPVQRPTGSSLLLPLTKLPLTWWHNTMLMYQPALSVGQEFRPILAGFPVQGPTETQVSAILLSCLWLLLF